MKKIILFTMWVLGTWSFGQLPSKVEDLRAKRDKAIENIHNIYRQELQKLLADPVVKSSPSEMRQIQAELDTDKKVLKVVDAKLFVRKKWVSTAGTQWLFEKNFNGFKITANSKIPFTWNVVDGGIVEVVGQDNFNTPLKKWYFLFTTDSTARYGDSKDNLTVSLFKE